jgi:hypothetical protein
MEEFMAGHVGVMEFIKKLRKGITKGGMVGPGKSWKQRASFSLSGAFKHMLMY